MQKIYLVFAKFSKIEAVTNKRMKNPVNFVQARRIYSTYIPNQKFYYTRISVQLRGIEKACESEFAYCFLTDFTKFFL